MGAGLSRWTPGWPGLLLLHLHGGLEDFTPLGPTHRQGGHAPRPPAVAHLREQRRLGGVGGVEQLPVVSEGAPGQQRTGGLGLTVPGRGLCRGHAPEPEGRGRVGPCLCTCLERSRRRAAGPGGGAMSVGRVNLALSALSVVIVHRSAALKVAESGAASARHSAHLLVWHQRAMGAVETRVSASPSWFKT